MGWLDLPIVAQRISTQFQKLGLYTNHYKDCVRMQDYENPCTNQFRSSPREESGIQGSLRYSRTLYDRDMCQST